jgi:hypothetical protein
MGSPNEYDMGGVTLVVKDLKVNATAPGQAGTALSATELLAADGVTAGTVTESKALVVDANKDLASLRNLTVTGTITRVGRQYSIPICGNAKVGATAGWVITAGTNIAHATLPASQTASTLVVPITGLSIGSTLTAVSVQGQVESAGNAVQLVMSVRKLTNAAADNTDAELGTDNVGSLVADTKLTSTELAVTGLSEVLAADESLYVLLTGTTLGSTDIDLTHLIVTVTEV